MLQWTVVRRLLRVDIKRQVYYYIRYPIKQIQRVKAWQLLIVLLLVGFMAATFLRLNNTGMAQRREAVLMADRDGRDADIVNRMYELQRYTSVHMNASTGQFDLTEQYKRDVEKVIEAATNDSNPYGNINAQAEAVCRPRFSSYSAAYLQCFLDEISKYPSAPEIGSTLELPSPALYRHGFVSPLWSPDFAGFSVLLFFFIFFILLGRLAHFGLLYLLLKRRRDRIGG